MTNAYDIDDKVIKRAQKLMAHAKHNANETEAAFAAKLLQELMAEHNLSLAQLEASGQSTPAGGKRAKENVGRRQVYKWQRRLMQAVASVNFVRALERFTTKEGDTYGAANIFDGYDLIGRVDNVTTATMMFDYLLSTIERLAREDVNNDPTQFFTRYAHSFKEGVSDRLTERLELQRRDLEREQERKVREAQAASSHPGHAGNGTSLILLSDVFSHEDDLNNDYQHGWEPGTTARKRSEEVAKRASREAERKRKNDWAKAQGHSDEVADWYAWGYTIEQAIAMAKRYADEADKPAKPETARERRARENANRRADDRYYREQAREHARLDRGAYRKGQAAGDDVSLNRQIDKTGAAKPAPSAKRIGRE